MSYSALYAIRCPLIPRTLQSPKFRSTWGLYLSISPMTPLAPSSTARTFTHCKTSWMIACQAQVWNDVVDDRGIGDWEDVFYDDSKHKENVEDYLNELSVEQQIAVNASAKVVRVIAGPGSGKTRVLISRAAKLISEGVYPENILMLTFTNKAAKEMKNRLNELFGTDFPDLEKLSIGTFHSICTKILRKHISKLEDGRDGAFRIIDDDEREYIIADILMEHYSIPINDDDSPATVSSKKEHNVKIREEQRKKAKNYSQMISCLKETSKTVHGLTGEYIRDRKRSWKEAENKDLVWIFDKYRNHLRNENLCDFGDLLGNVIWLLSEFPDVRKELKSQFQHILVDEMQDTNLPQYELLRMLVQESKDQSEFNDNTLFAVGDPNQAIYGFRGACAENLDNSMERDFGDVTKTFSLLDNYRSQAPIVRYAERILEESICSNRRTPMVVIREDDNRQQLQPLVSDDEDEEASKIVSQINCLTKLHGYKLNDIAILYRTHNRCLKLEEVFQRSKVPYRIVKGMSFMQTSEIKDVLAYLRFAANSRDEYAFKRIIIKLKSSLDDKTIAKLKAWAEKNGTKYPQWLVVDLEDHWRESDGFGQAFLVPELDFPKELRLSKLAKKAIQDLREIYCKVRIAARDASVKGAIQTVMQDCGYEKLLRKEHQEDAQFELAKRNIEALMNSVPANLEQDNDKLSDLRRFVQGVALNTSTTGSVGGNKKGVQLMTIHAAKGLEFPVVILVGCEDGLLPLRGPKIQLQEEIRLIFVAMTRAKDILILSRALRRRIRKILQLTTPSPFLKHL